MKPITTNSTITARFIGDADLTTKFSVIERKGQYVTIYVYNRIERKKIYNDGEKEYIYPFGRY